MGVMSKAKLVGPAAWRKNRLAVLDLFEEQENDQNDVLVYNLSWDKLWGRAKEKGIPFNTLKRHVVDLVNSKALKVEVDTSTTPPKTSYVLAVRSFTGQGVYIERISSYIEEKTNTFLRGDNIGLRFNPFYILMSDSNIPQSKTDLEEFNLPSIQISRILDKHWKNKILKQYSKDERETISKYESTLKNYFWIQT